MRGDTDLFTEIANGTLPAVSYVKPDGTMDGHPASSKWTLFEAFVKNIVDLAKSNPEQWAETAIFVTVDEGGGYYDSGPTLFRMATMTMCRAICRQLATCSICSTSITVATKRPAPAGPSLPAPPPLSDRPILGTRAVFCRSLMTAARANSS